MKNSQISCAITHPPKIAAAWIAAPPAAHRRDLGSRILHWLIALLVTLLALSGFAQIATPLHTLLGCALTVALGLRLLWMIPARGGRVDTAPLRPTVLLRAVTERRLEVQGRNPWSSWMAVMLWLCLTLQCLTGLEVSGISSWSQALPESAADRLFAVHRGLGYVISALAGAHVTAALAHLIRGDSALRAMSLRWWS